MPVSPPPDRILTEFLAVFRTAELDITRALAKAVERGTSTESLSVELAAATRLRQQVEAIQTRLRREVAQASTSMLTEAVLMGGRAAIADLDALLGPAGRDYDADFNRGALVRLARSLVDTLTPAITSITRTVDDVYRQVVGRAVSAGVVGSSTRREVTQRALDQFAARGVTSFTDVRGRRWQMDTYAEMAARTAMARAAVDAHTDRLAAEDIDLVHVSDSPQECPLCRPWEGKVLALDPGFIGPRTVQVEHMIQDDVLVSVEVAGSLEQARLAGLFHPNCFPGETLVSAPTGVRASDSRWYEGELVVIHTASGNELSATPNHPVLTPEGWVAAGDLQVGQHVLRYGKGVETVVDAGPGDVQVEARIGEVHDALRKASPVPPMRVPASPEQFHGDGGDSQVEVVLAHGLLRNGVLPSGGEHGADGVLVPSVADQAFLPGAGAPGHGLLCEGHAAGGLVGGGSDRLPLFGSHSVGSPLGGNAAVGTDAMGQENLADARLRATEAGDDFGLVESVVVQADNLAVPRGVPLLGHSGGTEASVQGVSADTDGGRDLARALSGDVALDSVVEVERRDFAGHVYNLQTGGGWYTAQGIVVHNCTHAVSAYLPGVTKLPTATENPKGYEDKQHLRYLERNLRAARRRHAAAITPAAKQRTARLVGRWLARLEEHVATSQAKRQLHREVPRSGVASRAEPDPVSPVFQRAERTDQPAEPRQLPSAERRQLEAPPAAAPEPSPQDAVQKLANELHATRPVRRTQRLRGLDGDTLQALIAEERRRAQLLGKADRMSKVEKAARAEVAQRAKPKPLAKLTMDELAERMNTALADGDMDAFDRLANEEDRRGRAQERRAQRAEAERERREQAQAETFEQLMTQGVDPEEADAIASGTTVEAMRRREVIRQLRESGYRGKSFDELARASFRDEVMDRYHRAEDATNGYLVNAEGRARAVDPLSLFTGPVARARKYASPELLEWFDQQGRLTLEEYKANLLGDSTSAARMRAERGDFYT